MVILFLSALGTSQVMQAGAASAAGSKVLLEHPEDLGEVKEGKWPASIWQLKEVLDT